MIDNTGLLGDLLASGRVRLHDGALLSRPMAAKGPDFDFGRVGGMLLGVAIGDALGVTTEAMLPVRRRALHGTIRHYLPDRHTGRPLGYPSDDSQLTFWTLEHLLEHGGLVPEDLARKFATRGRIFGIGSTVREFLRNLGRGSRWEEAGPESAGNGALMRVSSLLVPHLRTGGTAVMADVALASLLTHNDYASTSSCLAFASMLWDLLDADETPEPLWWVDAYVARARDLEGETEYAPRGGRWTAAWRGPLWRFVEEHVRAAVVEGLEVPEACDAWYSGAYLLETVPCVLHILARHADDPEQAILAAVNDTRDNDTIASIVGAAVGALHGTEGLPERWRRDLTGRTAEADDGRVFELIANARAAFWPGGSAQRSCGQLGGLQQGGE